jgi:hypothetical protein
MQQIPSVFQIGKLRWRVNSPAQKSRCTGAVDECLSDAQFQMNLLILLISIVYISKWKY